MRRGVAVPLHAVSRYGFSLLVPMYRLAVTFTFLIESRSMYRTVALLIVVRQLDVTSELFG